MRPHPESETQHLGTSKHEPFQYAGGHKKDHWDLQTTLRLLRGSWTFWGRVWVLAAKVWDLATRVPEF